MNSITFDTLNYSKTLQEAGMPREQAEAFAQAQKIAFEEMLAARELATQADILRLEHKLENKIEANKHEILKWMIGTMLAQTALIVAVIAFLK